MSRLYEKSPLLETSPLSISSSARDAKKKEERIQLRFAFFIFILPLIAIIFLRILGIKTSLFASLFFAVGTCFEFLLFLFLHYSYKKGKINQARFRSSLYLVYTALGLPFTIYLAQSPTYNILSFLRFLAVLSLLFPLAHRSALKWHLFFFFSGLFIYQFLQSERGLFQRGQGSLLILYILGLSLLWYRESSMAFLQRAVFFRSLHERRWEKKHRKQTAFLSHSLEALGYAPEEAREAERRGRAGDLLSGNYVIFAFFFSGIHESLWDFQKKSEHSPKIALEDFQREWEIFLGHLRQKLLALNLKLAIGGEYFLAGKLLAPYQKRQGSQQLYLNAKQKKDIFQILFAGYELLDFSARTRRALEQRTHKGWYLNILVALGPAIYMKHSLSNPALAFRGSVIKDIHRALQHIEEDSKTEDDSLRDRIWIESRLEKLYESHFEMSTALLSKNWKSPEFLLSEYTKDRRSIKPNQSFWASLDGQDTLISV